MPASTPTPATLTVQCSNGIAAPNPASNPGLVADCATLLAAKDMLEGESGNLNWSADVGISEWEGVGIDNDGVSSLDLKELYLGGNQLTGKIPPELGNLASLWYLDLSANQLTGEIPPELSNLANLNFMWINDNQLTGEIPSELSNLANLEGLNLSGNQLTGEIPTWLGNLSDLWELYLDGNQLTGCIPASLRAPLEVSGAVEQIGLPFCDVPTATPTPTPTITPTPTATPWAPQACAADILPYYFRIEELILSADIVARVRLIEIDDHIATFQTFKKWYEPHLWYEFEVLEYLKGSGSATIWGMTSGYGCWHTTDTAEEARSAIEYLRRERDARWDDREAIVFLSNVGTESVERTPSISHPDRYWLGAFLPGYGATESHSLTWAGGWFPMSPSDGASGASGEQRFIIVDPDNPPGDEWVNDHTKRARNAWRKLWASGSSDMTTMSISDLNLLIANEPELLRLEQEREISQMRDRTAPDELTATQINGGIILR